MGARGGKTHWVGKSLQGKGLGARSGHRLEKARDGWGN